MREEKHQRAKIYAVIPAAGRGSRMEHPGGKQLMILDGKTVIRRTCEVFETSDYIDAYLVLTSADSIHAMNEELLEFKMKGKLLAIIEGGDTRQESVLRGLRYLQWHLDRHSGGLFSRQGLDDRVITLVHDGARCLLTSHLLDDCAKAVLDCQEGVAAAIHSTDTIRVLNEEGRAALSPPRAQTILMQTPQGADLDALLTAYAAVTESGMSITDDIHALEHIGYPVQFIEGSRENIKLTVPNDYELALFYLDKAKRVQYKKQ